MQTKQNKNALASTGTSLKNLTKAYKKNYESYVQWIDSNELFKKNKKGESYSAQVATQLRFEIQENLNKTKTRVADFHRKNIFCNDSILLLINITILHGHILNLLQRITEALEHYDAALLLLIKYIDRLTLENDIPTQRQVESLFDQFNSMTAPEPIDEKETAETEAAKEINKINETATLVRAAFAGKCGPTIVNLAIIYDEFIKSFTQNNNKQTQELTDKSNAFFSLANNVKSSFDEKKKDNSLTTEYQLYTLEMNFYIQTIFEITSRREIWHAFYVRGSAIFLLITENLSNEAFHYFFKFWQQQLKQLYIKPSIELLETMNTQKLFTNIHLVEHFYPILSKWISVLFKAKKLFEHWVEKQLDVMKREDNIKSMYWKNIAETAVEIDSEINFLVTKLDFIDKITKQHNQDLLSHKFSANLKILDQVAKFKLDVGQLKKMSDSLKKKIAKLEAKANTLSNEKASELLTIEKQEQAWRDEKNQQRRLALQTKQTITKDYRFTEKSDSDEEETSDESPVINPNLEMLQNIDEESLKIARTLQPKTKDLLTELTRRSEQLIAILSYEHKGVFQEISLMLLDYYHLVSLRKKHESLSQLPEIKCQKELQISIGASHIELKNRSVLIYNNIIAIRLLNKEIKARQIEGREKKIIELGEQYVKKHKLLATPKETRKYGEQEFNAIGEKKKLNNQPLSQFSQAREFLELIDLPFLALEYLQEQIKPFLFENYNKALNNFSHFNKGKPEENQISYGQFYGTLGVILKNLYEQKGELYYLQEALVHMSKAHNYFHKRNDRSALSNSSYHLAIIKDYLAKQQSNNNELITQALKHFQDALFFNNEAKSSKLDLAEINAVNLRIEGLQEKILALSGMCK